MKVFCLLEILLVTYLLCVTSAGSIRWTEDEKKMECESLGVVYNLTEFVVTSAIGGQQDLDGPFGLQLFDTNPAKGWLKDRHILGPQTFQYICGGSIYKVRDDAVTTTIPYCTVDRIQSSSLLLLVSYSFMASLDNHDTGQTLSMKHIPSLIISCARTTFVLLRIWYSWIRLGDCTRDADCNDDFGTSDWRMALDVLREGSAPLVVYMTMYKFYMRVKPVLYNDHDHSMTKFIGLLLGYGVGLVIFITMFIFITVATPALLVMIAFSLIYSILVTVIIFAGYGPGRCYRIVADKLQRRSRIPDTEIQVDQKHTEIQVDLKQTRCINPENEGLIFHMINIGVISLVLSSTGAFLCLLSGEKWSVANLNLFGTAEMWTLYWPKPPWSLGVKVDTSLLVADVSLAMMAAAKGCCSCRRNLPQPPLG